MSNKTIFVLNSVYVLIFRYGNNVIHVVIYDVLMTSGNSATVLI